KSQGDLLISGQPGSGKTFLLLFAARKDGGLFAVTDNLAAIAGDLRAKKPRFVIVDDAHSRLDLLRELRGLREETGSGFRIVANSWPGDSAAVARTLDVGRASTRELALLTRDEIIEVLKNCGLGGPRQFLH